MQRTNETLSAAETLVQLRRRFEEADVDGSGKLDVEEMSGALRLLYRDTGTSRSPQKAMAEVESAMGTYDQDGNGMLSFWEFVEMLCQSDVFRVNLTEQV